MKSRRLLCAAWTVSMLPFSAVSAEETAIEHMIVTSTLQKTEAETALPVTILSGDKLREQVAASIGDTLANEPGLANASFGPGVGQPVIRGQQGPRVTVLENGIAVADAASASADHPASVEPLLAESIEVLRGPATLLYGGGAIGGVVNVIDNRVPTKAPDNGLSGAVEARYGSVNDERTAVVSLDGGDERMAFHVDGLSRNTNDLEVPGRASKNGDPEDTTRGYIANTDNDTDAFTLGGSLFFDQGYIGLAVNHIDTEYGIPPGAHGHGDEDEHDEDEGGHDNIRLDVEKTRYDLRGAFDFDGTSFADSFRWAVTKSNYHHDEKEPSGEVGSHFSNDSWQSRLELAHSLSDAMRGVMGLQYEDSQFSAVGEESFIPKTDIKRLGLFLLESIERDAMTYEAGVRFDRDELDTHLKDESFNSLSLSASALWQSVGPWSLGLAFSHAERAPVTEELFSNIGNGPADLVEHGATGLIEIGNQDLDTEQSNNLDLTLDYESDRLHGFVTAYHNRVQDYIYLANTGDSLAGVPVYQYRQTDADFTGLEFELTLQLGQIKDADLALTLFGDNIHGKLDDAGFAPRMPPRRLGGRLDFQAENYSAYFSVLEAKPVNDTADFETSTGGYTRLDAGFNLHLAQGQSGEWLLFLKLKNLTDEEIRSSVSLLKDYAPEAGRSVEAGIRLHF